MAKTATVLALLGLGVWLALTPNPPDRSRAPFHPQYRTNYECPPFVIDTLPLERRIEGFFPRLYAPRTPSIHPRIPGRSSPRSTDVPLTPLVEEILRECYPGLWRRVKPPPGVAPAPPGDSRRFAEPVASDTS